MPRLDSRLHWNDVFFNAVPRVSHPREGWRSRSPGRLSSDELRSYNLF